MFAAVNIISLPGGGGGYAGRWEGGCRTCPEPTGWQRVTFLTFMKTVHFRGKQGEQFEKTAKSDMEILCSLT
ncbi:MAG: hypothetical protein V8R87_00745 [Faecalibacterium prausnitzii]